MRRIEELNLKQKLFITHTYIYYELDNNIWGDMAYDMAALELEEAKASSLEWKHTKYHEMFRDWTSATGISLINPEDKGNYKFFMRQAKNALEAHQDYLDMLGE